MVLAKVSRRLIWWFTISAEACSFNDAISLSRVFKQNANRSGTGIPGEEDLEISHRSIWLGTIKISVGTHDRSRRFWLFHRSRRYWSGFGVSCTDMEEWCFDAVGDWERNAFRIGKFTYASISKIRVQPESHYYRSIGIRTWKFDWMK